MNEEGRIEEEINEVINSEESDNTLLLIVFQLGKEEYAVDINQIKEVVITPTISQIPHEVDHILGVANVRGKVIAVLDLALRFGLVSDRKSVLEGSYTLVIESEEYSVGIFVESVPQTISIIEDDLEPAASILNENGRDSFVKGIVKIENRMIVLLNIAEFLEIESSIEAVELDS